MIKLDEYFYKSLDLLSILIGNPAIQETYGIMFGEDENGVIIWFKNSAELRRFIDKLYELAVSIPLEDDNASESTDDCGSDSAEDCE